MVGHCEGLADADNTKNTKNTNTNNQHINTNNTSTPNNTPTNHATNYVHFRFILEGLANADIL